MKLEALTALSPLDGRYAGHTAALRSLCSEYALIRYRVQVELAWYEKLAALPELPECPALSGEEAERLNTLGEEFDLGGAARVKEIEGDTKHDVKAVEYYLAERFAEQLPGAKAGFLHFGCTSEDINNLAYALMLRDLRAQVLAPALHELAGALRERAGALAEVPLLARTHGQPASPTTLGKELANPAARLARQLEQLEALPLPGKWNGASGNSSALRFAVPEADWEAVSRNFVESFGLTWNPLTTQIEPHDGIAEFCDVLARANTVLLDLARDTWSYIAQGVFRQRSAGGEVGSSTMPHKVNPIDFENAEGNLGVANALLAHFSAKLPISRRQRDLSDSTVLRNLGAAVGYCAVAYGSLVRGLAKLEADAELTARELERHPEVLGEAVQTLMRRYGVPEPYEKLKQLTRGTGIDHEALLRFIDGIVELPEAEKARLRELTPAAYTGDAARLALRESKRKGGA